LGGHAFSGASEQPTDWHDELIEAFLLFSGIGLFIS
jgi:hypothetical protein